MSQLLIETDIETGLRWGELTELRVRDLDFVTRLMTVSRAVVQVDRKFHPADGRFLVKEYPKDGEYRCLKLSKQLAGKLETNIKDSGLRPGDLIFPMPPQVPWSRVRAAGDTAARHPGGHAGPDGIQRLLVQPGWDADG
jgi:integrase